jgi:hypothetical protein
MRHVIYIYMCVICISVIYICEYLLYISVNKSWKQKNKNNKNLSGCLPRARTGQRSAKACYLPRARQAERSANAFAESCTLGKELSAFVLKYEKIKLKRFAERSSRQR